MKSKNMLIITALMLMFLGFYESAYIVDETQQAVVTQFGRVVGTPKTEPWIYFRVPFIQVVNYFPKNLQEWDGDPGQIPTKDKTYIWVDAFARWKIIDPVTFFERVNNVQSAIARLDDIIDAAVRNVITSNHLIEAVRNSNREFETLEVKIEEQDASTTNAATFIITKGRAILTEEILKQAKPKLDKFGIGLVDVKFKRINYVEQVQQSVFGRMIAERKQRAEFFRSQGKGEANRILGDKEKKLQEITSEAYRKAQEIKGRADAEAARIYAEAFGKDPEFYSFTRTLEIYSDAFDDKSTLILSTDSEFLKYIKGYSE